MQIEALRLHDLRKDVVIDHVLLDDRRDTPQVDPKDPAVAAVSKVRSSGRRRVDASEPRAQLSDLAFEFQRRLIDRRARIAGVDLRSEMMSVSFDDDLEALSSIPDSSLIEVHLRVLEPVEEAIQRGYRGSPPPIAA